jgi:SpoVK/Ycf46/Vps4 family AAA+-type ATPase
MWKRDRPRRGDEDRGADAPVEPGTPSERAPPSEPGEIRESRPGSGPTGTSEPIPMQATSPTAGLFRALERLDHLLRGASDVMEAAMGSDRPVDRFRGLYVTHEDVERSLRGEPGAAGILGSPKTANDPRTVDTGDDTELGWLSHTFDLDPFDVNVLLLALAPEVDLKYERVYAFLQDNVTRTRPTVELALNLLCRSAGEKVRRMERFRAEAPLMRHGLIELTADPSAINPPLLAHFLSLDPQITAYLLGLEGLDRRLTGFAELTDPTAYLDELPLGGNTIEELSILLDTALETGVPLRLYLRGPPGAGQTPMAEAIAAEVGMPLMTVWVKRLLAGESDARRAVRLAFRQAWLSEAVILWQDADVLLERADATLLEAFLADLFEHGGISLLAGTQPWAPSPETPVGVVTIHLEALGYAQRYAYWESYSRDAGIDLTESEIALLAERFDLTPTQIEDAVAMARQRAPRIPEGGRSDEVGPPAAPGLSQVLEHVLAAARAQTGHALARLTKRIVPVYRRTDIVLPDETMRQLDEICGRVGARHTVLEEWGWGAKLSLGKGTSALFSGPSGCGKTMAAEVVASELDLDLFRIDLATVLDKYIGETEKKLERIFEAAEATNSVLLFDEADALFGKRSEVRDSHDRYANVEIAYLLQKIEEYDGLAILATNLPQNLDEAFIRRLTFTVRFPAPDVRSRRLIWEKIWPAQTPLHPDLDLDLLAREYRLTGGNIKNIAMAASFYAAEEGSSVTMTHLLRATRREFEQLGKPSGTRSARGASASGSVPASGRVADLPGLQVT